MRSVKTVNQWRWLRLHVVINQIMSFCMNTVQSGHHPQQEEASASHRQHSWMKCYWATQQWGYVWSRKRERFTREHTKPPNKLLGVSSDHWLDKTTRSSVVCSLPSSHKICEWMVLFLFLYISSISPHSLFIQILHTGKKNRKGKIPWDKILKVHFFNVCFLLGTPFWLF